MNSQGDSKKKTLIKWIKILSLISVVVTTLLGSAVWFKYPDYRIWVNNKLLTAVEDGDVESAKHYIRLGADAIGQRRNCYWNLLMPARESGNPEMITLLANNGADVNVLRHSITDVIYAHSPLEDTFGEDVNQLELVKALVEAGADWKHGDFLDEVIRGDRAEVLRYLIGAGLDPNLRWRVQHDLEEGEVIDMVALYDAANCCHVLIEAGASLKGNEFRSPLFIAVSRDNVNAATVLIEAGADLSYVNHAGYTPMEVAGPKCKKLLTSHLKTKSVDH
jgi:ankyrin repeat protein